MFDCDRECCDMVCQVHEQVVGDFLIYAVMIILQHAVCTLGADVNKPTARRDHTVLSLVCARGHVGDIGSMLQHGASARQRVRHT